MSKPNYCHITLVLDASSSMSSYSQEMISGVRNFLNQQENVAGEVTVSLVIFDGHISDRQCQFVSIPEAQAFFGNNYYIRGSTALYDAVYYSAEEVAGRINRLQDDLQPEKVIFAILTDGEDCASRIRNADSVKTLVDHYEGTYDWEFLYVGANQNAYVVGQKFGIKAGKALSWASSSAGLAQAMDAISGAVTRFRLNGAPHADQFFTVADHTFQRSHGAAAAPMNNDS